MRSTLTRTARIVGVAALALSLAAPANAVTSPAVPRDAVTSVIGSVHFRQMSARIIPDSTGLLDLMIRTNPDALAYDVTGYVQRTRSRSNDYRLSLARAKAVRAYMRSRGVTVPIRVHGARVPKKHPGRWDARRATVRVINDDTPVLQSLITTAWGTPDADHAQFGIVDIGSWTNTPDEFEYKWQYKFNTTDWTDIVNGDNPMGLNQSYSTSTATTDSVDMLRTSVYNYLQACGTVRGYVRARHGSSWSEWYETQTLLPQGCIA